MTTKRVAANRRNSKKSRKPGPAKAKNRGNGGGKTVAEVLQEAGIPAKVREVAQPEPESEPEIDPLDLPGVADQMANEKHRRSLAREKAEVAKGEREALKQSFSFGVGMTLGDRLPRFFLSSDDEPGDSLSRSALRAIADEIDLLLEACNGSITEDPDLLGRILWRMSQRARLALELESRIAAANKEPQS